MRFPPPDGKARSAKARCLHNLNRQRSRRAPSCERRLCFYGIVNEIEKSSAIAAGVTGRKPELFLHEILTHLRISNRTGDNADLDPHPVQRRDASNDSDIV